MSLDDFTRRLRESTQDLGMGLDGAQQLLNEQAEEYGGLKEDILKAAKRGEDLLGDIRQRLTSTSKEPSSLANVTAVER